MWLYINYEPVSAFGLRPSNTTSTGGKSLVCPTPYAIKMALLDRLIRLEGVDAAESLFPQIRDLVIHIRPPMAVSVNRTFQKVLRTWDAKSGWTSTIAQYEYCFHTGLLTLAVECDATMVGTLLLGFSAINYFGRRGSFMQFVEYRESDNVPDPRTGFVNASRSASPSIGIGFLQRMDDMRLDAVFNDVSIMNPKASGGRTSYTVIFPYRLHYHGFNHTVYELNGSSS